MANIRINKLALELNIQNDQIIEALQKHDIAVKNHMSSIDGEAAEYIRDLFAPKIAPKKVAKKAKAKIKIKVPSKVKVTTAKTQAKSTAAKKSRVFLLFYLPVLSWLFLLWPAPWLLLQFWPWLLGLMLFRFCRLIFLRLFWRR